MTVDRTLFERRFATFPQWECPTCGKGHLELDPDTLHREETASTKQSRVHEEFDGDWITERFSALLKCNFKNCNEPVAIGGVVTLELDAEFDEEGNFVQAWVDQFEPEFLSPAPIPIRFIEGIPQTVEASLTEAAGLIWQSPEASANKVRQAVEQLLDTKKVKKFAGTSKSKKLVLHDRIKLFEVTDPDNAVILFAIKWLGNSGSHGDELSREDVLDAFDFIELVLANLFGNTKAVMKKVNAVNKAKGPARKK